MNWKRRQVKEAYIGPLSPIYIPHVEEVPYLQLVMLFAKIIYVFFYLFIFFNEVSTSFDNFLFKNADGILLIIDILDYPFNNFRLCV